jgi:hypothetical protein
MFHMVTFGTQSGRHCGKGKNKERRFIKETNAQDFGKHDEWLADVINVCL